MDEKNSIETNEKIQWLIMLDGDKVYLENLEKVLSI